MMKLAIPEDFIALASEFVPSLEVINTSIAALLTPRINRMHTSVRTISFLHLDLKPATPDSLVNLQS